jgi:hypothetical protein
MTVETHSAKQGSESLDPRNLIETIPALVVCALPEGFAEFANYPCQKCGPLIVGSAALPDIQMRGKDHEERHTTHFSCRLPAPRNAARLRVFQQRRGRIPHPASVHKERAGVR